MEVNPIIYTAHHKPGPFLKSSIFQPVHVGRALASPEIAETMNFALGDDTGENISHENKSFAELTCLYWIWKNTPEEYTHVGFMHYSRHLNLSGKTKSHKDSLFESFDERVIKANSWGNEEIEKLCSMKDIVVPEKWPMHKNHIITDHERYNNPLSPKKALMQAPESLSMYHHYALCHIQEDLDLVLEILKEDYPEIYNQAWTSLREHKAHFCNMFIMKRHLIMQYCEMLFDVIEKLKQKKDYNTLIYQEKGAYNGRIFAFTAERIFSFYLDLLAQRVAPDRFQHCSVSNLT